MEELQQIHNIRLLQLSSDFYFCRKFLNLKATSSFFAADEDHFLDENMFFLRKTTVRILSSQ